MADDEVILKQAGYHAISRKSQLIYYIVIVSWQCFIGSMAEVSLKVDKVVALPEFSREFFHTDKGHLRTSSW